MKYFLLTFFCLAQVQAYVGGEILVRGKISNSFDDQKVQVVDSLGQKYYLPRKVFPQHVLIKQGASFSIEVGDDVMQKVVVLKK